MRLLFIYGSEPSGHASAAAALEEAARTRGIETMRLNVSEHHYWLGPFIARLYLGLIQRFPWLWRWLYEDEVFLRFSQYWRVVYLSLNHARLEDTLDILAPDIVVCTHAPPLAALALEKERGYVSLPLAGVITDLKPHNYWVRRGADLYIVPVESAAREMEKRGIPKEKIRITGIPIHPTFREPIAKPEARTRLGLPVSAPVIFLSGGSRGLGDMSDMAYALLEQFPDCELLIATGDNDILFAELTDRFHDERRIHIYPFLDHDQMKELMCAADLLVGNAGGLTISESLALGLPMVFFEPLPGQEEGNASILVKEGVATIALTFDSLVDTVEKALKPKNLKRRRARALTLARPDSAERALNAILSLAPNKR